MYYNSVWPGAYDFKSEIKLFIDWFKGQLEVISKKIEETEKKLGQINILACIFVAEINKIKFVLRKIISQDVFCIKRR